MNTVFVVQYPMRREEATRAMRPVHDITPAARFGNLEFLLPAGPVLLSTDAAVTTLRSKLRGFKPGDYMLCLGDPVAIAAAAAVVAQFNGGVIPMLVWDKRLRDYLPITVDTNARRDHHAAA